MSREKKKRFLTIAGHFVAAAEQHKSSAFPPWAAWRWIPAQNGLWHTGNLPRAGEEHTPAARVYSGSLGEGICPPKPAVSCQSSAEGAQTALIKQEISKWHSPVNYILISVSKMWLHINTLYQVEY